MWDRDTALLEVELSVTPMFQGGPLLVDVAQWLTDRDFEAVALEHSGGDDPASGRMLWMDGIFRKRVSPRVRSDARE